MDSEENVRGAEILLEQMVYYQQQILEELNDEEAGLLSATLPFLMDQAATVKTEAGLLALANAVHTLVEELPGLRRLLIPEEIDVEQARAQRTIPPEAGRQDNDKSLAVKKAAGNIENHILVYSEQLNKALPEPHPPDPGLLARLLSKMGLRKEENDEPSKTDPGH